MFPPLISAAVLVVGILLDWLLPLSLPRARFRSRSGLLSAFALLALGIASAIIGNRAFKRIGTNVNPMQPALAPQGKEFSRISATRCMSAWASRCSGSPSALRSKDAFALVVGALPPPISESCSARNAISSENSADDYHRYKQSVPRYGWNSEGGPS